MPLLRSWIRLALGIYWACPAGRAIHCKSSLLTTSGLDVIPKLIRYIFFEGHATAAVGFALLSLTRGQVCGSANIYYRSLATDRT